MKRIEYSNAFKRDFKKYPALALSTRWIEALHALLNNQALPPKFCDHALTGNWNGFRDCHIEPDLVLIYRHTEDSLELARIGSHAALFG